MTEPVLVELEDVAAGYGRHRVFEGLHLAIREGEYWFLLGSNGAGKTTLLRVLLGLLAPQGGRVRWAPGVRESVGYVPQYGSAASTLPTTVAETVRSGLVGSRLGRSDRQDRVSYALSAVRLSGLERRDLTALSGGQRRRAFIARALVRRPRLLILDEPTSGLDLTSQRNLMGDLEALNASADGPAILFVSHDLATAEAHGSHAVLLGGEAPRVGLAGEVLTPAHLAETFGVDVTHFLPGGVSS